MINPGRSIPFPTCPPASSMPRRSKNTCNHPNRYQKCAHCNRYANGFPHHLIFNEEASTTNADGGVAQLKPFDPPFNSLIQMQQQQQQQQWTHQQQQHFTQTTTTTTKQVQIPDKPTNATTGLSLQMQQELSRKIQLLQKIQYIQPPYQHKHYLQEQQILQQQQHLQTLQQPTLPALLQPPPSSIVHSSSPDQALKQLQCVAKSSLSIPVASKTNRFHHLRPAGIFWDIENCHLSRTKSFFSFVEKVRKTFITGKYREFEFVCVCDSSSLDKSVVEELNLAQVNIVHVNVGSKNACDDKLKQLMFRFVDVVMEPAAVFLISCDINFISVISDLKHRKGAHIVLLCRDHISPALLATADESYDFIEFTQDIELNEFTKPSECRLLVTNLPTDRQVLAIRHILNKLVDNCGGKIIQLDENQAIIRFSCLDSARRCFWRISNFRIYGRLVNVRFLDALNADPATGVSSSPQLPDLSQQQQIYPAIQESCAPQRQFNQFLPIIGKKNIVTSTASVDQNSGVLDSLKPPSQLDPKPISAQLNWSKFRGNVALASTPQLTSSNFQNSKPSHKKITILKRPTQTTSESSSVPTNSGTTSGSDSEISANHYKPVAASTNSDTILASEQLLSASSSTLLNTNHSEQTGKMVQNGQNSSSTSVFTQSAVASQLRYLPPTSILVAHKRNDPTIPLSRLKQIFPLQANNIQTDSSVFRSSSMITPPPDVDSFRNTSTCSATINTNHAQSSQTPVELLVTNLDSSLDPNSMKKALIELFRQHGISVLNVNILTSQQLPLHLSHYAAFFKHLPHCYLKAIVKVASQQDAQSAVSQLHRTKLIGKRIVILYLNGEKLPPTFLLKAEIAAIFEEFPNQRWPLIAFQELYEKRYHRALPMADIYKLKDVIQVCSGDNPMNLDSGKHVQINPDFRLSEFAYAFGYSRPSSVAGSEVSSVASSYTPIIPQKCPLHPLINAEATGWAEQEIPLSLPFVCISLKQLSGRVHTLLQLHGGCMPLTNLVHCYVSEFDETFDETSPNRVPLEHLLTCIPGVQIVYSALLGYKRLQWVEKTTEETAGDEMADSHTESISGRNTATTTHSRETLDNQRKRSSRPERRIRGSSRPASSLSNNSSCPSLMSGGAGGGGANESIEKQTNQFCREVRDLLKNQPQHCLVSFSRFVPAYHSHFGRQCCVYQYGFTKLIDLLESISHVIQVMGEGSKRAITLTHREQIKRFVSDLLRVLKAQPGKRLLLSELPQLFEKTFEKTFRVQDYGVCFVEDMLSNVWPGTLVMTCIRNEEDKDAEHGMTVDDQLIELPKREQSEEERQRTRTFAAEVIELLRSVPTLSLTFSKFIPFYHHYYNRQCKVSDFGFSKLIELLEALESECLELSDGPEEKLIRLNFDERRAALYSRFHQIIKDSKERQMTAKQLNEVFRTQYGFHVNYLEYGCDGLVEFIGRMPSMFQLRSSNQLDSDDDGHRLFRSHHDRADESEIFISIVDERVVRNERRRLLLTLMESAQGCLSLTELCRIYSEHFQLKFKTSLLDEPFISRMIERNDEQIRLRPVCLFIRDCIRIVQRNEQKLLTVKQLEDDFNQVHRRMPKPADYGYSTWVQLFNAYGEFMIINKRRDQGRIKWILTVNQSFVDRPLQIRYIGPEMEAEELPDSPQSLVNVNNYPQIPLMKAPVQVPPPPFEWLRNQKSPPVAAQVSESLGNNTLQSNSRFCSTPCPTDAVSTPFDAMLITSDAHQDKLVMPTTDEDAIEILTPSQLVEQQKLAEQRKEKETVKKIRPKMKSSRIAANFDLLDS